MKQGRAALATLLLIAVAARWQTFGNPVLGFDEQFYLLVGDRMLHGALPFVDVFDRKPIGLFAIYALAAALPDPVLAYQLLALAAAVATAAVVRALAMRVAPPNTALAAGIAYLLWLNFAEGEGGQAPVFYNLPVAAAALLVLGARDGRANLGRGMAAMALFGIALQIKYTAVFEGGFFGLLLLWKARGSGLARLFALALGWATCAALPTLLVAAGYGVRGHLTHWWFANVLSNFGRLPDVPAVKLTGLLVIAAVLAPLVAFAARRPRSTPLREVHSWLAVAVAGMLAMGAFASPHYALPVLVPLAVAAAPGFARWPRSAAAMLVAAFAGSQLVLALSAFNKGGRAEADAVAAAARLAPGERLWVHDGWPALYRLTRSPLPTRWAFPGSLNTANEASAAALGVDPTAEVRRLLATRPAVIVTERPAFERGNRATLALVEQALAARYRLAADVPTAGGARHRLVYRLRSTP